MIAFFALFIISLSKVFKSRLSKGAVNIDSLSDDILDDLLNNILPFWIKYSVDPSGGFYGELKNDGSYVPNARKGTVLNARIIWTFSSAYRLFDNKRYLDLADRAQRYFLEHFVDQDFGGVYSEIYADGTVSDDSKQNFVITYSILGLAEHYRSTGNQESLNKAIELYNVMENRFYDETNDGYFSSFSNDWKLKDGSKTMNDHMHIIEAYTLLYQVWPQKELRTKLYNIVNLYINKIINESIWHQNGGFSSDWKLQPQVDSYGHDMEISWMLTEAADVLNDEALIQNARRIALKLVESQVKDGMNADGSLRYQKTPSGDNDNNNLEWWPQTETINAFLNLYNFTREEQYLESLEKTWNWIKQYMIDREYGEWYSTVFPDGHPDLEHLKAGYWRCPYHTSRIGFRIKVGLASSKFAREARS